VLNSQSESTYGLLGGGRTGLVQCSAVSACSSSGSTCSVEERHTGAVRGRRIHRLGLGTAVLGVRAIASQRHSYAGYHSHWLIDRYESELGAPRQVVGRRRWDVRSWQISGEAVPPTCRAERSAQAKSEGLAGARCEGGWGSACHSPSPSRCGALGEHQPEMETWTWGAHAAKESGWANCVQSIRPLQIGSSD
jgi:hypothetical protein